MFAHVYLVRFFTVAQPETETPIQPLMFLAQNKGIDSVDLSFYLHLHLFAS
jgi:hypothetical protein